MQAGDLTPIEKAERRVLVLCNPGLGIDNLQATPSIYVGLQLILPGEDAPNHRHSPSAIRLIVEGAGGFTTVEGERLPMEPGDLILTPSGLWHEHGHTGSEPVIWMDALDLPLIYYLETSQAQEAPLQHAPVRLDSSQTKFRRAGLLPYDQLHDHNPYPMLRYPWKETREALTELASATDRDGLVQLAYINPVTGQECLPILGFSALMLRPGENADLGRRTCSAVTHVVEGHGSSEIDDSDFDWNPHDMTVIPPHASCTLRNHSSSSPAFLFIVDDAPLHRKLGFYREYR
jgi:gentisate 1,2-dioxygenase